MRPLLNRIGWISTAGLLLLMLSSALAQGGLSLGATVGLSGEGAAGVNVRAAWTFLEPSSLAEPLGLAVRADAAFSLTRLTAPALGVTLLLTVEPPGVLSAWIGGGPGVTFPTESTPLLASACS